MIKMNKQKCDPEKITSVFRGRISPDFYYIIGRPFELSYDIKNAPRGCVQDTLTIKKIY